MDIITDVQSGTDELRLFSDFTTTQEQLVSGEGDGLTDDLRLTLSNGDTIDLPDGSALVTADVVWPWCAPALPACYVVGPDIEWHGSSQQGSGLDCHPFQMIWPGVSALKDLGRRARRLLAQGRTRPHRDYSPLSVRMNAMKSSPCEPIRSFA